ncbi:hypothetical protein BKA66DRAFT_577113 [Pyrenochaeta sp. MPI-SDFR-AT-0127]|nr:hypothetical protein BKA66DRAFT_577113 [Pyrenochaeta sp. MPI-SDFR-AT-0127]
MEPADAGYRQDDLVWILWNGSRSRRARATRNVPAMIVDTQPGGNFLVRLMVRSQTLKALKRYTGPNEYTVLVGEDPWVISGESIHHRVAAMSHFSKLRHPIMDDAYCWRTGKAGGAVYGLDADFQKDPKQLDCTACLQPTSSWSAFFCTVCDGLRHHNCNDVNDTDTAWRQAGQAVLSRDGKALQCVAGENEHDIALTTTAPSKVLITIDIGTTRPRIFVLLENEQYELCHRMEDEVNSAVWWFHDTQQPDPKAGSCRPPANHTVTIIDPLKVCIMLGKEHPKLQDVDMAVIDIYRAFLAFLFEKTWQQATPKLEKILNKPVELTVAIAVPAALDRSKSTPLLTALYTAARDTTSATVVKIAMTSEPHAAYLGSPHPLEPNNGYIAIFDIGGTTLCASLYTVTEGVPDTCIVAYSMLYGHHNLANAMEELECFSNANRTSIALCIKDTFTSKQPELTFKDSLRATVPDEEQLDRAYTVLTSAHEKGLESATAFLDQFLEEVVQAGPAGSVRSLAIGGGTIDPKLMDLLQAKLKHQNLEDAHISNVEYSPFESAQSRGLQTWIQTIPEDRSAPYHIALEVDKSDDVDDDDTVLIVVVKKGDALVAPIVPHDQIKPGQSICINIEWHEGSPYNMNLYGLTIDDSDSILVHSGYRILKRPSAEQMWILSQIKIAKPETAGDNEVLAFVTLWPNVPGKTMVLQIVLAKIPATAPSDQNYTIQDFDNGILEKLHEETQVVALDPDDIDHKLHFHRDSTDTLCHKDGDTQ